MGFFRSLYDFGFTSLIGSKIIRFVYGLSVVLYTIGAALAIIAGIQQGSSSAIVSIIVVPIGYIWGLIWLRILMEFLIVFFRMGDDIHSIRTRVPADGRVATSGTTALVTATPAATQIVPAKVTTTTTEVVTAEPVTASEATTTATPAATPPAGWYDAPGDPTQIRYWDGNAWTTQYRPKQGTPADN
jgi:hypothetical protein